MTTKWSELEAPREVGEARVLVKKYGKEAFEQDFLFPSSNGEVESFFLFGSSSANTKKYSCIVFPLTRNGNVILIRQFRCGAGEFVVEIPGGSRKLEENPEDAIKREFLEETGYEASRIVNLCPAGVLLEPCSIRDRFIPFLAEGCVWKQEPTREKFEIIESKEVSFAECLAMTQSGEIKDSKTLATLFLATVHLGLIKKL